MYARLSEKTVHFLVMVMWNHVSLQEQKQNKTTKKTVGMASCKVLHQQGCCILSPGMCRALRSLALFRGQRSFSRERICAFTERENKSIGFCPALSVKAL